MICCVTGHRPQGFPFPYDLDNSYFLTYLDIMKDTVEDLMYEGYTHFISGMSDGVDLDFASEVERMSNDFEGIILESALPYPLRMPLKATDNDVLRNSLVDRSQKITVVSPQYFRSCMQKRNRYMVDRSDLVLAVWNGEKRGDTWYTIEYANKTGKPVRYIMLKELTLKDNENSLENLLLIEETRARWEREEHLCSPNSIEN